MSTTDAEQRWSQPNDDAASPAEPLCTLRKPSPQLVYTTGSAGSLAAAEHRSTGDGGKRLDATLLEQHGVDHVHVLLSSGGPATRMRPTIKSRQVSTDKSRSSDDGNKAHTGDGKRPSAVTNRGAEERARRRKRDTVPPSVPRRGVAWTTQRKATQATRNAPSRGIRAYHGR